MQVISNEDFVRALQAEGLADSPLLNSPQHYGVRVEEKNGVKTLVALTAAEYKERAERYLGRPLKDGEFTPSCYLTNPGCYSSGCTAANGTCSLVYDHGWYCICIY